MKEGSSNGNWTMNLKINSYFLSVDFILTIRSHSNIRCGTKHKANRLTSFQHRCAYFTCSMVLCQKKNSFVSVVWSKKGFLWFWELIFCANSTLQTKKLLDSTKKLLLPFTQGKWKWGTDSWYFFHFFLSLRCHWLVDCCISMTFPSLFMYPPLPLHIIMTIIMMMMMMVEKFFPLVLGKAHSWNHFDINNEN